MKIARGDVSRMLNKLEGLEDLLCRIDAECYMYGVQTSSKDYVNAINNLYKCDNYYRWESLLYGHRSRKIFEAVFDK